MLSIKGDPKGIQNSPFLPMIVPPKKGRVSQNQRAIRSDTITIKAMKGRLGWKNSLTILCSRLVFIKELDNPVD